MLLVRRACFNRDIVLYRHKDLTKAATIVLQPHSSAFLKMSNHQAVMETELRHYSAITRGTINPLLSTICLPYLRSRTRSFFVCARRRRGPVSHLSNVRVDAHGLFSLL